MTTMNEILVSPSSIAIDGEIDYMMATPFVSEEPESAIETPAPAKRKRVAAKKSSPRKSRKTVAAPPPAAEVSLSFGSYSGSEETEELGVIDQVRAAMKSPLATMIGFLLGGFVPLATYSVKHFDTGLNEYVMWTLVIGGLIYSAITVHTWASNAFQSGIKALGFVVLVEGVMTLSGLPALSYGALALLIAINGVATGANLSLKGQRAA